MNDDTFSISQAEIRSVPSKLILFIDTQITQARPFVRLRAGYKRVKFDFFKWDPDKNKRQDQSQQAPVCQEGTRQANTVSRNHPVQKADKKGVSI